jgi:hypothetical protein
MTEIELAQKFIDWFSDYEIYKEVPTPNGRADFYVIKGPMYLCVEVKKQFSFEVVSQAVNNFGYCHYSYIAVPKGKNQGSKINICEKLGIGVLTFDEENPYSTQRIYEHVRPAYRRNIYKPPLLPEMKLSIAGAQHNNMSEFKVTIRTIENILNRRGGVMDLNELFEKDSFHYSHSKSARQCIVRLVKIGALKQFYIENKQLKLKVENDSGSQQVQ